MTSLIECRKVWRSFEVGGQPFHALRDVDLDVAEGELIAIVGASGSGKSSLMNLIGGLDLCSTGQVLFRGQDLATLSEPALAQLRNREVGFVFQQFNLLPRYSALRNVEMPMMYAGVPQAERAARASKLLSNLGLSDHLGKRPAQMSGGQQQRVAIARALGNQPRLILADEPTGALDSKTSKEVLDLLVDLNRMNDITVMIVTHDMKVASQCDRIIRFADGKIVEDTRTKVLT